MDISLALETFAVALALFCVFLMPVAIQRDPGLARRIVPMTGLPRARWPNLLTRVGVTCLLASFVLLLIGCYTILAGA